MKMLGSRTKTILLQAVLTAAAQSYYSYGEDCGKICLKRNMKCLISENRNDFVRRCASSATSCEEQATPNRVRLRPNLPAKEGENIWLKYKEKLHPILSTTPYEPISPIPEYNTAPTPTPMCNNEIQPENLNFTNVRLTHD